MNKKFYLFVFLSFFIANFSFAQVTLSGKVLRHNGTPIEGVTVTCTGVGTPVISDADGSFTFADLPEGVNYSINGFFETDFFEDISILDVAYGRELILYTIQDSIGFQWWAADINSGSGSLSTYDLVIMRKAVLKIDHDYLDNYWLFFDQETGPQGIPTTGINLNNVTEDISDLELVGLKLGDPAINEDHLPPPPSAPQTEYYKEDISVTSGEQFTFNIRVNDFEDIVGFQHGLKWNAGLLDFVDYENTNQLDFLINEDLAENGDFLLAAINSVNTASVNNGDVLYAITFTALEDIASVAEAISFSSDMIPLQTVYRQDGWLYLLEDTYEGITTSSNEILSLEKFDLIPNPAQNEVFLNVLFDQAEKGNVVLYDITGKLLNSWNFSGTTFQQTIDIQNLSKGTYVLKVITTHGLMTKKLVKQ